MINPWNNSLDSTSYSDNYCVIFEIVSATPMRLSKTQFFEKRAALPVKKCVDLLLFRDIQHDKPQETTHRVHNV